LREEETFEERDRLQGWRMMDKLKKTIDSYWVRSKAFRIIIITAFFLFLAPIWQSEVEKFTFVIEGYNMK